jgi:hypothetical protein
LNLPAPFTNGTGSQVDAEDRNGRVPQGGCSWALSEAAPERAPQVGLAAQRLIELEIAGLPGSAYGEKNPERLVQRKRCRDRT